MELLFLLIVTLFFINPKAMNLQNTLTTEERLSYIHTINFNTQKATPSNLFSRWTSQMPFLNATQYWTEKLRAEGIQSNDFQTLTEQPNWSNYELNIAEKWFVDFKKITQSYNPQEQKNYFINQFPNAGFMNVLNPFIDYFAKEFKTWIDIQIIDNQCISGEELMGSVLLQFNARLYNLVHKSATLEFQNFKKEGRLEGKDTLTQMAHFAKLLNESEVRATIWEDYPVLARIATEETMRWQAYLQQLISRYLKDYNHLKSTFFQKEKISLTDIHLGQGDRHNGGESVAILKFANGQQLVYKPRNLALDLKFQELLNWVEGVTFKSPKIISQTTYGWVEFISHRSCKDLTELGRFYERTGYLLALLYILNASDFHFENIIADGAYPVLIDLECMFHPVLKGAPAMGTDSVLQVGLLPVTIHMGERQKELDLAGLVQQGEGRPQGKNMPFIKGQPIPNLAEYAEELEQGFKKMYKLVLNKRLEFLALVNEMAFCETRILFRDTEVYANLLRESYHPTIFRNQLERERHCDWLWAAITQNPNMKYVIPLEKKALLQEDVPSFTTRANSIHLSAGKYGQVQDFFAKNGLEVVQQKINGLSTADLQKQIWLIQAAIATTKEGTLPLPTWISAEENLKIRTPQDAVKLATRIGDYLEVCAFTEENAANWMSLSASSLDGQQRVLSVAGHDMFDGITGNILCLAYLHKITGKESYKTLANKALSGLLYNIEHEKIVIPRLGAFSGWGGVFYVLTHLATLWKRSDLLDFIEARLRTKELETLIYQDDNYTVIHGCAGFILGLRAYYQVTRSYRALELMKMAGDHLISNAKAMPQGVGWKVVSKVPLSGVAHGASGFAYALSTLYELTGEPRYLHTVEEALKYEDYLYVPSMQNWQDCRDAIKAQTGGKIYCAMGWSHGAPGIGMVRIELLRQGYLDAKPLNRDFQRALNTTIGHFPSDKLGLSLGTMGNIELLLNTQLYGTRKRGIDNLFSYLPDNLAEELSKTTSFGLMSGLSGIAYQLLRLAHPYEVPSVLMLHPPKV